MFGFLSSLFGKKKLSSILSHFQKDKENLETFIEQTKGEIVDHNAKLVTLATEQAQAERVLVRVKSILGEEE